MEAAALLDFDLEADETGEAVTLRVRFRYTGESWWLPDWDFSELVAAQFIDRCAEAAVGWVRTERQRYGPTMWD